jgi:tetratricopeptide (TPR) repeat protein
VKTRTRAASPSPGAPAPAPDRWPIRLAAVLIVLAACAAYANSLPIPFVLDDEGTVVQNPEIRQLGDLRRVLLPGPDSATAGRPLVSLSFALNYAAGGLNPAGYHAVNLVLHILCALLIFGIVRRTLAGPPWPANLRAGALPVAKVAALLWAVHPLTSEVIDYVTQRTEALAALWILGALYAARRFHEAPDSRWNIAAIACGILGALSKEIAVVTPVLVALYDRAFLADSWRAAWRSRRSLYVGLMASWLVVAAIMWSGPRAAVSGFSAGVSPWTYLLNQAVVILDYLRLSVWPAGLVAFWGWPVPLTLADVWLQFIVVALLVAGSVVWFIKTPRLAYCLVWVFVILAPTSSFVPIATEVGAERRMYLPLAGLITLVVAGSWHVLTARRDPAHERLRVTGWTVATLALAAVLGWTTAARNREYATPLTLAQTILERRPTPVAHQILGEQLALANRVPEALTEYRAAVSQGNTRAVYPLAMLIFNQGDVAGAVPHLERVVELAGVNQPLRWLVPPPLEVLSSRLALSQIYASQQRWADAEAQARQVLARVPGQVEARRLLAVALVGQQRWADAIAESQQLLAAYPNDVQARINLGIALASSQRFDEAITEFRRALSIDPQNANARRLLALAEEDAAATASR